MKKEENSTNEKQPTLKNISKDEIISKHSNTTDKKNERQKIILHSSPILITGIVVMASVSYLLSILYVSPLFYTFYLFLVPFWLLLSSMICLYYQQPEWAERLFISGLIVFGIYCTIIFIILTIF
ncbi:MAG: hypothetical protein ACTSRW_04710 [Candidatus Helarchaeota archaeon]